MLSKENQTKVVYGKKETPRMRFKPGKIRVVWFDPLKREEDKARLEPSALPGRFVLRQRQEFLEGQFMKVFE